MQSVDTWTIIDSHTYPIIFPISMIKKSFTNRTFLKLAKYWVYYKLNAPDFDFVWKVEIYVKKMCVCYWLYTNNIAFIGQYLVVQSDSRFDLKCEILGVPSRHFDTPKIYPLGVHCEVDKFSLLSDKVLESEVGFWNCKGLLMMLLVRLNIVFLICHCKW